MFELSEAKRVCRADLNASDDSGTDSDDGAYDADLQARLNAQIARSLSLTETYARLEAGATGSPARDFDEAEADADDNGDEVFAFRLFSTTQPSQKVILEEDTGPKGDGAIVISRPLSYYVVTQLTEEQKRQYAFAAVTGDDVLARSKDRAWGLEMPWRVTSISVTGKRNNGEPTISPVNEDDAQKKRRPGKKQRISLRKRAVAKEEKKKAETQRLLEKEEHAKDKKKRMNRLKKLRKRAKNKEAKLVNAGDAGAVGESEPESDASE